MYPILYVQLFKLIVPLNIFGIDLKDVLLSLAFYCFVERKVYLPNFFDLQYKYRQHSNRYGSGLKSLVNYLSSMSENQIDKIIHIKHMNDSVRVVQTHLA